MLLQLLISAYVIIALGLAAIGLDDDEGFTRRELAAILFAALLWPLFHLQWRHKGGHHQQRVRTELDVVGRSISGDSELAIA